MCCERCRYHISNDDDCLLGFEGAADADGEPVECCSDVCMCEDFVEE